MPLFNITVFIRLAGLSLLTVYPVMPQQPFVCSRELSCVHQVVHRRAQPVRAVLEWNSPQLPQRILQPFAQALEGFRIANGPCFPVRVGQNEVIDQMRKCLPIDGDAQLPTMCVVCLSFLVWLMFLCDVFFVW